MVTLLLSSALRAGQDATKPAPAPEDEFHGRVIDLPKQILKPGAGTVQLDVELPRGYHFAAEAPTTLKWKSGDEKILRLPKGINGKKGSNLFPLRVAVTSHAGTTSLTVDAAVFFCENGSKLCQMDNVRIKAPIEVAATGTEKITLSVEAGGDDSCRVGVDVEKYRVRRVPQGLDAPLLSLQFGRNRQIS